MTESNATDATDVVADVGLRRRAAAEGVGTAFLVTAVVGSGIAAARLSPGQIGLQLLENALVTGAALVALILALHPVSAAFNPVITLVERATGALDTRQAATLVASQFAGGLAGVLLANVMFDLPAVTVSTTDRSGAGMWLAEVVATAGLVLVVLGTARSGHPSQVAYAVGGYITAAYWFTSSTSYANPAVTVARMLTDTFSGIAPSSAPAFIAAQLMGGLLGLAAVRVLFTAAISTVPATDGDAPIDAAAPIDPTATADTAADHVQDGPARRAS